MEPVFIPNLINQYINYLLKSGKSQHTAVAYKKDLEQFSGYLASIEKTDIREVKKEDISGFIKKTLTDNYTKKSASRKLNSIRGFFRYLKNEGVINQNPALEVPHPKYNQKQPRILTKLEYRALRDFSKNNPRNFAIIETLLQTGIRISELASLRVKDIKDNHLVINNNNQKRETPLNKSAKKAINAYLRTRNSVEPEDYLFTTRSGRPMIIRNIRQIIVRCFQEVEIQNATVNDLRNTFIAYQLAAGVSADYVAKVVGHKRLSSTERYLSLVSPQSEKKQKLEEL